MHSFWIILLLSLVTLDLIKLNQTRKIKIEPTQTIHRRQQKFDLLESLGSNENRIKRETNESWMVKEFEGNEQIMKMHAFIVRDEEIPPCCAPAKEVSNNRYFMCTGAVLTLKHAITTASCMHFADVYESHISANLALLVGGTTPTPYVIRINRYEMHPNYVFDVDAKNHSTHNLAILFLACSILPEAVVIPKLPQGMYDDVGHMCCGTNCDVITIVQTPENRQFARKLKARHLPSPRHDPVQEPALGNSANKDIDSRRLFQSRPNVTAPFRRTRSVGKLAPAPVFFFKDSRSDNTTETRKTLRSPGLRKRKKMKSSTEAIAGIRKTNQRSIHIGGRRNAEQESLNPLKIDEDLASVDWDKVEETIGPKVPSSKKTKMEKFAKDVVEETMKRLKSVIGGNEELIVGENGEMINDKATESFLEHLLSQSSGNKSIDDVAQAFATVITHLMPPHNGNNLSVSSDLTIEANEIGQPPAKYVECPPLGTPIIIDGTLVGMVAYTCDEVQSWVEWKYVSISKNMIWIQKRLAAVEHQSPVSCTVTSDILEASETNPELKSNVNDVTLLGYSRSVPTQPTTLKEYLTKPRGDEGQYHGDLTNVIFNNPADQLYPEISRGILKYDETGLGNSTNNGNFPVNNINGNTCFTSPDGSTDCRSITNTYTLQ